MKMSILDAITKYKSIHSRFSNGSIDEDEAGKLLSDLAEESKNAGLVFAPTVQGLYDHAQFDTMFIEDEESSSEEYEEEYVSSEY